MISVYHCIAKSQHDRLCKLLHIRIIKLTGFINKINLGFVVTSVDVCHGKHSFIPCIHLVFL